MGFISLNVSDWKLDVQSKLLTWQWAKVICGERVTLSTRVIYLQTELPVLLQGPGGSLDNELRADAYHADGWSLNCDKLEYWTVSHFLLCPTKIPQDGCKQLLNNQWCFGIGHCKYLLSSLISFLFSNCYSCSMQLSFRLFKLALPHTNLTEGMLECNWV